MSTEEPAFVPYLLQKDGGEIGDDHDLPDPGDEPARVCPYCRFDTLAWWEKICRACDRHTKRLVEKA